MAVSASRALNPGSFLQDTRLRRQLPAEFMEIAQVIERSNMRDEMTESLREWLGNFREALRYTEDERWLFRLFTDLLHNTLRDPVSQLPLDAEAVLGTDGRTYGSKSLRVHLSDVNETLRFRSPLEPNNPQLFTVSPHPVAREAVRWLQRHGQLPRSQETEDRFQELTNNGGLARLPTPRAWQNQGVRNRLNQAQQDQQREDAEFAQRLLQRNDNFQGIQQIFNDINARQEQIGQEFEALRNQWDAQFQQVGAQVEEIAAEGNRQELRNRNLNRQINRAQEDLADLEQNAAERNADLDQRIARLQGARQAPWEQRIEIIDREVGAGQPNAARRLGEIRDNRQALADALNRQAAAIDAEVEEIERENGGLRDRINNADGRVSEKEKQIARVALAIKETEKAIKKRQSGGLKSLAWAAGIAVGGALLTWGMTALAQSIMQGATMSVTPGATGFSATLAIPI